MASKDSLGDRMKDHERRTEVRLPRRVFTVVRLDGKAFHTYTKGLQRPYDPQLMYDMADTARYLAKEVGGCKLAYTQSDEITLVLSDRGSSHTEAWFDGKLQKIVSVTASMAAAMMNQVRPGLRLAVFDSRAFTVSSVEEAANCLVWRQQDAVRNSISMTAQSLFSHKELQGVSSGKMQEMLWSVHGVNWNDEEPRFKRGQLVRRVLSSSPVTFTRKDTGATVTLTDVQRTEWKHGPAPTFTQSWDWLLATLNGELLDLPEG